MKAAQESLSNSIQGDSPEKSQFKRSDAVRGFLYSAMGDLAYSFSYLFIRFLTGIHELNTDWTLFIRESVTVACVLPMILIPLCHGRYRFPPVKQATYIIIGGFFGQFLGSRSFLWAYAALGIVLAMPLLQSSVIFSTHLIGMAVLKEKITRFKIMIMTLLVFSFFWLSFSQHPAELESTRTVWFSTLFLWGLFAVLLNGIGNAVCSVFIRSGVKDDAHRAPKDRHVPVSFVLLVICFWGVLVGGGFLWANRGPEGFIDVPSQCWIPAIVAGFFNFVGFSLKIVAFRYVTASKIALLAVLQIVFLTIIGSVIFKEEANLYVWIGVLLTCLCVLAAGKMD